MNPAPYAGPVKASPRITKATPRYGVLQVTKANAKTADIGTKRPKIHTILDIIKEKFFVLNQLPIELNNFLTAVLESTWLLIKWSPMILDTIVSSQKAI